MGMATVMGMATATATGRRNNTPVGTQFLRADFLHCGIAQFMLILILNKTVSFY